jgi:hypothetical protein
MRLIRAVGRGPQCFGTHVRTCTCAHTRKHTHTHTHTHTTSLSRQLVGGTPEFGAWTPEAGVALEWSEGNVWSATMPMELGNSYEFKVVVVNSKTGASKWEAGDNRVAAMDSPGLYVMDMEWNQIPGTGLVKVDDIAVPGPAAESARAAPPAVMDSEGSDPEGSLVATDATTAVEEESEEDLEMADAAAIEASGAAVSAADTDVAAAAAEQPAPGAPAGKAAAGEGAGQASPASSEGYYAGMVTSGLSEDNGASSEDMLGRNLSLAAGVTVLLAAGVAAFLSSNGLLELPALPEVAFSMPAISLPSMPSVPAFSMPQVALPSVPAFSMPEVALPSVMPSMPAMPEVALPSVPAFSMPEVSMPDISMPIINLPSMPSMPAMPASDAARTVYALPATPTGLAPN